MCRLLGWFKENAALATIMALYVILALGYNLADPLFEPPDEVFHYGFVRYIQQEHALPVAQLDTGLSEYHQPPLYYAMAAFLTAWVPTPDYAEQTQINPFWGYNIGEVGRDNKNQFLHGPDQRFPYRGTTLAVHLIRLLSTVAGLATVYLTYRLVVALLPDSHFLALSSAALVAFTPNFLLTTAAVTNDSFASLFPVGIMVYALKLLDQPHVPRLHQWAVLGLLLGLGALIKVSVLPLMVVSAALAGVIAYRHRSRHRSWRVFITAGVILGGCVLLLAGWWFIRNLVLYGDLTGLGRMWQIWGTRPPLSLAQYRIEAWNFRTTYWANFGYGNVPAPTVIYHIIDGSMALAGVGLMWRLADRVRSKIGQPNISVDKLFLLALWVVLTSVALLWYLQRTIQVTGRQIYPLIPAVSFCLVWGWARFLPRRWWRWSPLLMGIPILSLAVGALVGVLIPAYRPAPRLPIEQAEFAIPHRLDWRLGDVAILRGYTVSPDVAVPGERVTVTLYWEPIRRPEHNYTVFVHLFGENNTLVGARDTYPGLGNDPTLYWSPGEIIVDATPVPISVEATGPILLEIEAGLYDLETGDRLPITDSAGNMLAYPVIGTVKLRGTTATLQTPAYSLDASFSGGVSLRGYNLSEDELSPGDTLTLTLFWASAGPLPADYTVFVHMVDADGQIVAQGDGPPRGGRYPTSVWGEDEFFDDLHVLLLPSDLASGHYTLLVGLYNPMDNTRLALESGGDTVQLDQVIWVR
jgi:4-amino-4-deoxy-L-arabinose transferase-like glycosyltransferase